MQHRGSIVYHDLVRTSSTSSRTCLTVAFVTGFLSLAFLLEFGINMAEEDHKVIDPPLQPDSGSESDDLHGPPPTPWTGVVLNVLMNLTLKQFLLQFLHLDCDVPGLVRVLNNSVPIDLRSTMAALDWPRRLYVQVASYTEFQRCVAQFGLLLAPDQQRAQGIFPVRMYLHFVSAFRAIEQYEHLVSAQSVVISRLENRISRLERSIAHGEPLTLTPRLPTECSVWFQDSPSTQPEPSAATDAD